MKGENTLNLRIIPERKQTAEALSPVLLQALWDLISAPDPYDDMLTAQWYAIVEAGLLDMSDICITHEEHAAVMAHGAALSPSELEVPVSNSPRIEFEI